jgi:uncharacterized protein YneF (UPF0154 family)
MDKMVQFLLCYLLLEYFVCLKKNISIDNPYCPPLNFQMLQDLMHHMGLYMAKSRGAKIVDRIIIE